MTRQSITVEDTVSLPCGFTAAGIVAGIKAGGKRDLMMLYSALPAAAAGVFTTNQVKAAPVRVDQEVVRRGRARAIVANSGNANACTGARGLRDARRMAAVAAAAVGVKPAEVLVCSTGPIGKPMPMDVVEKGLRALAPELRPDGGNLAAESIMTTDTAPKRATARVRAGGADVLVAGLAKGAGMIAPNMATMLGFVLTDAAVEPRALRMLLREAAEASFNRITVDGDMSTNDTLLLLANGAAGGATLRPGHRDWTRFAGAVHAVCLDLALRIARDGEGATKLITVHVRGARSGREAEAAARAVANSFLVKTCWHGDYPNWGRIMDAIGYSAARVDEGRVSILYDDLPAVRRGVAAPTPLKALSAVQARERFAVTIDLGLGRGEATVYTCDCSEAYVKINVDYVQTMTGRGPT